MWSTNQTTCLCSLMRDKLEAKKKTSSCFCSNNQQNRNTNTIFFSQAQWAIVQWPSRLWLEYYSIVCLHLRRKVLIVRHTPFSRIPGSQICVEICDWAKMYRPVPLSSWAVLKCIMISTLQFFFSFRVDINECQISNPWKNGGQYKNTHGSYERLDLPVEAAKQVG